MIDLPWYGAISLVLVGVGVCTILFCALLERLSRRMKKRRGGRR